MGTHNTKVTFRTIKNDIKSSDSAVREAVANAIDADAKNVYLYIYVEEDKGSLGNMLEYFCLDIADDGNGIPVEKEKFEEVFCQYKVSTKQDKTNYGKKGKGRYTYLTLPRQPEDAVLYTKAAGKTYQISFICRDYETIQIVNQESKDEVVTKVAQNWNTLLQFKNLSRDKFNLDADRIEDYSGDIKNEIISFFADRIASKSIKVYINNELLDINDYLEKPIIKEVISISTEELDIKFEVDFFIWNEKVKLKSDRQKHILFFDTHNILKGIAPSGKDKLSFLGFRQNHTMIVKSKYFNDIDFIENSDDYNSILLDVTIKSLRQQITNKLENILFEIYRSKIDKVSDDYLRFLKVSQDEITKKAYYAIMLPFVEKFGNKNIADDIKSIIVNLIGVLIQEAPDSYIKNMSSILKLKQEDSEKVRYVEENYGIIRAISEKEKYIKRIDFLNTFDNLVNGAKRSTVKERTMLHHIVDKNLWLFGEDFENLEYKDIASDVSLKTILENKNFYQFDSNELKEIVSEHKLSKVPDIFIPIEKNNTIYIIELKKPKVNITQKIVHEIMDKYVSTLKEINKKYDIKNKKRIYAIAISDVKSGNVYSFGNLEMDGISIVPKTWSEILGHTRDRYRQKIDDLDNKLKLSKWKSLESFVLSHNNG